jgi:xanthine dehydrogenase accessory factor
MYHTTLIPLDGSAFSERALPTPAHYIGMIGSLRKVEIVLEHLRAEGTSADMLTRVRAPIGLNLGGREPAEIALAILAEIECVRHGGDSRPRSDLSALHGPRPGTAT